MNATSEDRFLNGRVIVNQPLSGFRAGLDAVMLAAAIGARPGNAVLELGAGAGTASLCLAHRIENILVDGLEIDPALVALANANAKANQMDARVRFTAGDVFAPPASLRRSFDHVFCNPPFHDAAGRPSRDAARARALHDEGRLEDWLAAALKRTAPKGSLTVIVRADRLATVLAALPEGGVALFPLWPRRTEPAKRIIVQLRKGSEAPLAVLPGLVLHDDDGRYTREADAILRDGASLALTMPRL